MNGEINGIVMSGALIHGQYIQSGTVYPYPTGASLASGNVQSGHVASGAVPGYFGPTRAIQSGSVGAFDFGSGAVMAGQIGSGAVQSGNIASGSISANHTVSGTIYGVPVAATLASGDVQSGHVTSGSVPGYFGPTRAIQSGTVGSFDLGSGAVVAGAVGSGAVVSGNIGSGQIGAFHLGVASVYGGAAAPGNSRIWTASITSGDIAVDAIWAGHLRNAQVVAGKLGSGAVVSGNIASGQIGGNHLSSGIDLVADQVIKWCDTTELISGQRAVMWASGGYPRIKRADPRSGQYTPVVGVTLSGGVSGASVAVVVHGPVPWSASGMMASGFHGAPVFAGSGGTVVMASGTHAGGASSGGGIRTLSGMVACGVGTIHSGMVYVSPDQTIISQSGNTIARRGFVF